MEGYQKLSEHSNEEDKLEIEKLKLAYIQCIELHLKRDLQLLPSQLNDEEAPPREALQSYCKKILYYLLMIFGTLNDAVRNYLFGSALFSLIPNLVLPIRIILSVFYIVFEAILFYGFELFLLRSALGISNSKTNAHKFLSVNIEQVRATTRINQLLMSIQVLTLDDQLYQDYRTVVASLNDDLEVKRHSIQCYDELFSKKLLKASVLGFGIITNIASSYFMIHSVLTTWAAALLGTPLGWGIIFLAILVELGFYYFMGAAGVIRLMNANHDDFKTLKNELSIFNQEHLTLFSTHVRKKEHCTQATVLHDMGTQTDVSGELGRILSRDFRTKCVRSDIAFTNGCPVNPKFI
ncbi:MAG: hypothetical protein NXI01_02425 [Gammaproteobacteria bacterium]|nr:hypothetical protein [Gammaproteobacteria bacterium]